MKNIFLAMLLMAVISFSCGSTISSVFGKKTPREKYEEALDDNDLENTAIGRQWLAASKTALEDPQAIQLPYKHVGFFNNDKPRALGLKFTAKKGEQLMFSLHKKPSSGFVLYVDLFRKDGTESTLLLSVDTTASVFSYDIVETGNYVLRLQPELYRFGAYDLSVSVGPSLGFPVGDNQGKVGSFWGASRGGGKRSHEGIDIFAPKRTPVVAAADGVITGVKQAGIGGKVVWLKLNEKDITLYYAHLDKQLVREGQLVKKGETLGLVGNTGNAKHTASHLHFGVYTTNGPIDPFPFVNPAIKMAPPVAAKSMIRYLRLTKPQKAGDSTIKSNTLLIPVAATATGYVSELPNGKLVYTSFSSVETTNETIKPSKEITGQYTTRKRAVDKKQ